MNSRAVVLVLITLLLPSIATAAPEPLPDVVLESVVAHSAEDALGRERLVTVNLRNDGDAPATGFSLQVWAGHDVGYRRLHDDVHNLPAGATLAVIVPWDTLGEIGTTRIEAIAGGVREADYENNRARTYTFVHAETPASADVLNVRAGFPLTVAFIAVGTWYDADGAGAGGLAWTWPSDADAHAGLTPEGVAYAEATTFGTHGRSHAAADADADGGARAEATAPLMVGTYGAGVSASPEGTTVEACGRNLITPDACVPS